MAHISPWTVVRWLDAVSLANVEYTFDAALRCDLRKMIDGSMQRKGTTTAATAKFVRNPMKCHRYMYIRRDQHSRAYMKRRNYNVRRIVCARTQTKHISAAHGPRAEHSPRATYNRACSISREARAHSLRRNDICEQLNG